jgi:hypothetical protein
MTRFLNGIRSRFSCFPLQQPLQLLRLSFASLPRTFELDVVGTLLCWYDDIGAANCRAEGSLLPGLFRSKSPSPPTVTLLFNGGCFAQVPEGPLRDVEQTFEPSDAAAKIHNLLRALIVQ